MEKLAPDVGTIVQYGSNSMREAPETYRVSAWMRVAPTPTFRSDDFISEILFEASRVIDTKNGEGKKRLQYCLREEATHLSLSGICGSIAPIEQCKVIGRVEWSEQDIERARNSANRLGAEKEML